MSRTGRCRSLFWGLLLVASLAVIVLELRSDRSAATPQAPAPSLLLVLAEVDQVTSLEIVTETRRARLTRDSAARWRREEGGANEASFSLRVDRALEFLARARAERRVDPTRAALWRYGLETPEITISFSSLSPSAAMTTLRVGAETPDRLSVYVDVDPGVGIVTTPRYHVRNLRDLVCEIMEAEPC